MRETVLGKPDSNLNPIEGSEPLSVLLEVLGLDVLHASVIRNNWPQNCIRFLRRRQPSLSARAPGSSSDCGRARLHVRAFAGAQAWIELIGEDGNSTGVQTLHAPSGHKCLQRDSVDKFEIQTGLLKNLASIRIGHNGAG